MGKNCKLKGELSCNSGGGGGGDEDASCKSLATLEKANPDATFTCVGSSGKKETVKCAIGDKFDQITGKEGIHTFYHTQICLYLVKFP